MTEHEINTDNAPTPNVPLLRKAVEWVEAEAARPLPEREWNQASWFLVRDEEFQAKGWCGTACCVAGWVGLQSTEAQPQVERDVYGNEVLTDRMEYPSGLVVHVSDFAQSALGLTDGQAADLFAGGNTAGRIREVVESIVGEPL